MTLGVVQTATFTLVSLLLAFSFSLALSRYEARRALVARETNAVGTAILRADLLPPMLRDSARDLLRQYVEARIGYLSGNGHSEARAAAAVRTDALQQRLWRLAVGAQAADARSTSTPLFIQAVNDAIDVSSLQRGALAAHIPDSIILILIGVVLTAGVLFGFTCRSARTATLPLVALALVFGVVIATIVDLDQPQSGWIRVDLTAVRSVQNLLPPTK
ncbi:MAG: hypothetical protein ACREM8_13200 [Vulcanimicrobiaceae bacterium]